MDQFSHWLLSGFQVVSGYPLLVGIAERDNFYNFVRQLVEQDRPTTHSPGT